MIRTVLAISAGLLCALYGLRASARMRREALDARRWAEILARLELLIGEATLPLPDALRHAADDEAEPDRLLRMVADDLTANPLASLPDLFEAACPTCAGRETLLRLFRSISRGSAESRCLAVQSAKAGMTLEAERAEARAAQDARLIRTLGWTGGACLTLLLL